MVDFRAFKLMRCWISPREVLKVVKNKCKHSDKAVLTLKRSFSVAESREQRFDNKRGGLWAGSNLRVRSDKPQRHKWNHRSVVASKWPVKWSSKRSVNSHCCGGEGLCSCNLTAWWIRSVFMARNSVRLERLCKFCTSNLKFSPVFWFI